MTYKPLYAVAFLLLLFTACTKEQSLEASTGGGSTNDDIIGNYDFIDMYVIGESTVELNDNGWKTKTVTETEYRTINNTGTATITKDVITYKNLSYAVDTFVKSYLYDDDVLIDSFEMPFAAVMPTSTISSTYKRIGADSLYYANGMIMNTTGGNTPTIPQGVKYTLVNGLLTLTSPFKTSKTETIQGVPATTTMEAVTVVRLRKQ